MFYFLIFHTSISANKELDKKLLTTFLYGCILYIILHAILNSSDRSFIKTIKQYFWFIFGLDVICMIYIYKTIYDKQQESDQGSQSLLSKLSEFFENLIDTSIYKDKLEIRADNNNISPRHDTNNIWPVNTGLVNTGLVNTGLVNTGPVHTNPVPITTTPHTYNNQPRNQNMSSILKPSARKSVEFSTNRDEIREFSSVELPPDNDTLLSMITSSNSNPTPNYPTNNQPVNSNTIINYELATPIRQIRSQHPTYISAPTPNHMYNSKSNNPNVVPSSSTGNVGQQKGLNSYVEELEQSTPLSQIRQQVKQFQQPNGTIPPPISAKHLTPIATKVKPGDVSVGDIKYDPSEIFKNIQYETRLPSEQTNPPTQFPNSQSNLPSDNLNNMSRALYNNTDDNINTGTHIGTGTGTGMSTNSRMLTDNGSNDEDRYSVVSKVSDLGSMLDFDIKEFENSI